MGMFDFFKKKEKKEELSLEDFKKEIELPKQPENPVKTQEQFQPFSSVPSVSTGSQQDRISLIESKLENLRIYLEMINSKLDRLETLLRAKGLI